MIKLLCRQNSFSHFLVPCAALLDISAPKTKIELRRRALKDIELVEAADRVRSCAARNTALAVAE